MRPFITTFLFFFSAILIAQPPAGYYNNATGTGEILKTQLYNIIKDHTVRSYDYLWTAFQTTDDRPNGKVWDMYSNCDFTFVTSQCGEYANECDCYNREHSFPQSWFNAASPMVSDLFQVYPTDGKVNGVRDNYPYGTVATPNYTTGNGGKRGPCSYPGYTGIVFEPIDEYKGDFARTYFYMATRYENLIANWYANDPNADAILMNNSFPVYETWFLNLLGQWHTADPVSQKEIDRNNAVYAIQNNRNPFIDNPGYVSSIWGVGASGLLAVSPASLSGFTYAGGAGPSASQSYTLSGANLAPASGNITVTGTANFEVSTNNSSFNNSVTVPYTASALANTPIYVRLKSGLSVGSYSNNLVTNTGGGASTINVSCSGTVTVPVLPEPTNYPLGFSAHNIHLQWVDATGTILPDGYLLRMSPLGYAAITDPANGTVYPDSSTDKNVAYGVQNVWFTGLVPNTVYYFKIFSYKGSGAARTYKTDGTVPQLIQATTP
jgi:endonuclease I